MHLPDHTTAHPPTHPGLGPVSPSVLADAGVTQTGVEVTDAFLLVMHRMRDHLHATAERLGMTPPMLLTLRMLERPLAQREIAAAIGCDPSYVTGLVDRLEQVGAVERTADPADRRVNRIVLTDAGRSLRARAATELLRGMPLLVGLDDASLAQLHGLLLLVLAQAPEAPTP